MDGFWIDRHPVTNAEFARFVTSTGHVTVAEQAPDPADYPGARPELLVPASVVFQPAAATGSICATTTTGGPMCPGPTGATRRGRAARSEKKPDHPVVHVAWDDAAGVRRLGRQGPADRGRVGARRRGGLDGAELRLGRGARPGRPLMANTWQGEFPIAEPGAWTGTSAPAPVGRFPPNGYGLCRHDRQRLGVDQRLVPGPRRAGPCLLRGRPTPAAGARSAATTPAIRPRIPRRVMKGGSHLCAPNYCRRYRPAARMAQPIDTGTSHLGFRCVLRG